MGTLGVVGVVPTHEGCEETVTATNERKETEVRLDGEVAVEAAPECVVREGVHAIAYRRRLRVRTIGRTDERRCGGLANASG